MVRHLLPGETGHQHDLLTVLLLTELDVEIVEESEENWRMSGDSAVPAEDLQVGVGCRSSEAPKIQNTESFTGKLRTEAFGWLLTRVGRTRQTNGRGISSWIEPSCSFLPPSLAAAPRPPPPLPPLVCNIRSGEIKAISY